MRAHSGRFPGGQGGHDTARRRTALYAALAALLLGLALVTWISTDDTGRPGARPAATSDRTAPDLAGTPGAGAPADTRRPAGHSALVDNPLYATGPLMPLPCPAPELDVHEPASMKRFLNTMTDCLDDAWGRQFEEAGIPFEPPRRVYWSESGSSPCRDYPSAAGAFYCRAVKSVYIGTSDVVEKWGGNERSAVYASLLAHEYGHHVQGEAGLLEYYHDQRADEPTRVEQNAWTRKSELQANCLAGAFLGSVEVTYPLDEDDVDAILDDAAATADRADAPAEERTHGTAENSVLWLEHGLEQQAPGACNTWTVDDESVLR
ncbi:neutral zinc metallopeptidase [Streptomonospora litoralis]|uniref:Neutral zinc metallopeptidase n=1 Tax=Streptomonospora litoralis TaxID=2498135 RepID=A0A4P6Q0I1_9ACTN|nr:neutral zinc metallopeptidase [Streptomonospora litoralis]QBI52194.1 Putative neutral zinc metallopeptidase [Streptomonospora litoralis]